MPLVNGYWHFNYYACHTWVRKNFEKTGICEICKLPKKTEWSNTHPKRELWKKRKYWQEVCRPCHRQYDLDRIGHKYKKHRVKKL